MDWIERIVFFIDRRKLLFSIAIFFLLMSLSITAMCGSLGSISFVGVALGIMFAGAIQVFISGVFHIIKTELLRRLIRRNIDKRNRQNDFYPIPLSKRGSWDDMNDDEIDCRWRWLK